MLTEALIGPADNEYSGCTGECARKRVGVVHVGSGRQVDEGILVVGGIIHKGANVGHEPVAVLPIGGTLAV